MQFKSNTRKLSESVRNHTGLNPKLFDSNNKLKPDVLEALINIGQEFVNTLNEAHIPIKVEDIWLVGSNASYNYTDKSDLDLHIQANFADIEYDSSIMQIMYDYVRSAFNKNYDIIVKGIPVEVYVEDINTTSVTNGIYSLYEDTWVKFPKKQMFEIIDVTNTREFKDLMQAYRELKDEDVEEFLNALYMLRKKSLTSKGEFDTGNLIFKEFRNRGILQDLKDRNYEIKSRELSLENLHRS